MRLKLYRSLWGVPQPWEEVFPKFREAGFAGVECRLPPPDQRPRFRRALEAAGLGCGLMAFTEGNSVRAHVASFRRQAREAAAFGPAFLTVHSGADAWPAAEARTYFREALAIERDLGLPVGHETHRGRILFHPFAARALLADFPDLRLCCDFSHWVCVCERLLPDCQDILRLAADRAVHVHARVGYEQGPQVPDPAAPEYHRHLEAHERWWQMIWASQRRRGFAVSTITPEFGPPGYMHTLPHTNLPVADLWRVTEWMAGRLRARFRRAEQESTKARRRLTKGARRRRS